MKKRSLLIVVALLCMASLMAAMAYSTATITNKADLSIVNTSDALLQLYVKDTSKVGLKDGAAYYDKGNLKFNFDKGLKGNEFGLQKNSEYVWFNEEEGNYYGLFWVYNKSNENLNLNLKATGVPEGVDIYAKRCWSGKTYSEDWVQINTKNGYTSDWWNPGANNDFGIKIVVGDDAQIAPIDNMNIVVTGIAD